MKLKELAGILFSRHGDMVSCIVYDTRTDIELYDGCTVDFAVQEFGERTIVRITAYNNKLVLHLGE